MKLHNLVAGAVAIVLGSLATTTVSAADLFGGHGQETQSQAVTMHIGPGYRYDVLTTIRSGTAPRLHFCEYHGRWCYGSYGRFNGWYFGGENNWDHWSLGYWR